MVGCDSDRAGSSTGAFAVVSGTEWGAPEAAPRLGMFWSSTSSSDVPIVAPTRLVSSLLGVSPSAGMQAKRETGLATADNQSKAQST